MIIYGVLRQISRLAIRWFYRSVEVVGIEQVPRRAPVLLVANHPNALVDALVIGMVIPRRVTLTAKATLFEHPVARAFFRRVPIVPLRRASDERKDGGPGVPDPARNRAAFAALLDELGNGGAVLIFPEGRSHSESQIAPLRSGAARIALEASIERGILDLEIVPVGLTFEHKSAPRSRVLVLIGEPIAMRNWTQGSDALTTLIDTRLRAVTLNFQTGADAERVLRVTRVLSQVADAPRSLAAPDVPLASALDIAHRVEAVRDRLEAGPSPLRDRAEALVRRLAAFEQTLAERDIPVNDLGMSLGVLPAARFVVREGALIAFGGPLAWWGRVNHWLPLRLAGAFAERPGGSPEEPAMRTIVAGAGLVLLAYALQSALVYALAGPWWALGYLGSLPPSASLDFRFRDRARRAWRRMRAYLHMRARPGFTTWLRSEAAWLAGEAAAIERVVSSEPGNVNDLSGRAAASEAS
jgi:glycerol-3-phosphate O-acyltransferase / dihydroxyacetone phosphate acyltransferase